MGTTESASVSVSGSLRVLWWITIAAIVMALAGCGGQSSATTVRSSATHSEASGLVLSHGHWSVLPRSPLGTRYGATFIWDGRELLELGGGAGGRLGGPPNDGAAAYTPATRSWRILASVPATVLPDDAASTWTGQKVFIFGGPSLPDEAVTNLAGLYDPLMNRWKVTSRSPVGPFNQPVAVWTGKRVILAGMTRGNPTLKVASYNPVTNTWATLQPTMSPRHHPLAFAMVATNHGVLLWSMWGRSQPTGPYSGVDVFRLSSSGDWINVTGSWPQDHTVDAPIFTGKEILVAPGQIWCGVCSHPAPVNEHSYWVNPTTLQITPLPNGPLDDLDPQIIWTGTAEIALNTSGGIIGPHIRVLPGDIAIWNRKTKAWSRGPRAPEELGDAPAVWANNHLYVLAHNGTLLAFGP